MHPHPFTKKSDFMNMKRFYAVLLMLIIAGGAMFLSAPLGYAEKTNKGWTLTLKDVDIRAFLEQVASITGENFVVDPEIKGRVSVIATTPMSTRAVNELFLTVLRVNGLAAVPSGSVTRIVPQANAKLGMSGSSLTTNGGQRVVTRVLPVKNLTTDEAVKLLKPLVSQTGLLDGSEFSSSLIVSDYADNVVQIMRTLAQLDTDTNSQVEIIPLKEAWVGNIVPLIESVAPMQLGDSNNKSRNRLKVIADERSNSIIVRGDPGDRAKIRKLVETFDQKSPNASDIQVIHLHYADAKEVATLVRGMLMGGGRGGELQGAPVAAPTPGTATGAGNAAAVGAPSQAEEATGQGQSFIQPDTTLNTIVVRAEPALMSEIKSLVRQLDMRRPQVLIEAAIVEISADKTNQLGVQLAGGDVAAKFNGGGTSQFSNSGLSIGSVLTSLGSAQAGSLSSEGLNVGFGKNTQFDVILQAIANTAGANLLSTPSIITLDNEEAKIVVGQNVPFRTGSFTTQSSGVANPFTTIDRQDIGITLKVLPQIHEGNLVRMNIDQEVSSIAPSTSQTAGAADLITNKRTISTKVLAEDGETIVLGGLIEDDNTQTESKVPLLGDIPVLGALFRNRSESYTKRNLLVFLRPTVLRGRAEMATVTQDRYGRVYDLEIGRKRLDDDDVTAKSAEPVPPAGTIFNSPSKVLPWLVGEQFQRRPASPPVETSYSGQQPVAVQPYVAQPYVAQPYVAQPYVAPPAAAPVVPVTVRPIAAQPGVAQAGVVQPVPVYVSPPVAVRRPRYVRAARPPVQQAPAPAPDDADSVSQGKSPSTPWLH